MGDIAPRGAPDGRLDIADAILAMRFATGLSAPTLEEGLRADVAPAQTENGLRIVKGDDDLDVGDVVLLLRAAVGLETLAWPVRQLVVHADHRGPLVAFSASVANWPRWAELVTVESPACPAWAEETLDVAESAWMLTCVSDPSEMVASAALAAATYRAAEPIAPATLRWRGDLLDGSLANPPTGAALLTEP